MQGILFDLDGVLTDSHDFHYIAWKTWSKKFDFDFTEEFFKETFGQRNDEIIPRVISDTLDALEIDRMAEEKEAEFRAACAGKLDLFPGVEAMLSQLKERNIPRIIATSTPRSNMEFFLTELNLSAYFDAYICGNDVKNGKPAPDPFLAAARALSLDPVNCLVVEDSLAGIESAKAAGCQCLAVATTKSVDQLHAHGKADKIVRTTADMIESLLKTF